MLDKIKQFAENARLRAGATWREHKERAAEKKAERQAARAMEHHHGRFFLLTVPAVATMLAAITEWYWAILFCIEATGSIDWNYDTSFGSATPAQSLWNFAFSTHWPVFLGLVCATVPIVMLSMVWLPLQFAMRGAGRFRRGSVIAVGVLANILVIVSGTVVMNYNRQDQVREALVIEQTAAAGRGAIQAQIDAVNNDLERLTDRRINNEYAATAANVGAAAYRAQYMSAEALERSPEARRDIIVRALGAAERADALRAERTALFQQLAQAPTEAAVAANVEDTVGAELNTFAQYVEVWRPPFIAVICTLIGIFGTWWVIAMLERMNPRDVLRSGWADEGHRIEDLRDQAPVEVRADADGKVVMDRPREKMYDAETGEELVPRRGTWAKKPKRKGKPERVDINPEIPPDERGVDVDGGARIATSIPGVPYVSDSGAASIFPSGGGGKPHQAGKANPASPEGGDALPAESAPQEDAEAQSDTKQENHEPSEPPELSDEQLAALSEPVEQSWQPDEEQPHATENTDRGGNEVAPELEAGDVDHIDLPNNEGVIVPDAGLEQPEEEPRAPETREDRLIGVAAE